MNVGGTTSNDQRLLFPTAGGLGVLLSPPQRFQGRALMGVQRAKPTGGLEILQFHLPKMPKIHPRGPFTLKYNFMNFVDVIKSSTEVAVKYNCQPKCHFRQGKIRSNDDLSYSVAWIQVGHPSTQSCLQNSNWYPLPLSKTWIIVHSKWSSAFH